MIGRAVNIALGVWLMAAPAVLGYAGSIPGKVERTVGPLVASAAIVAIWPHVRPLRWANVVLGGWMMVAPLILRPFVSYPAAAKFNSVVTGMVIVAAALVRGSIDARFGGGWRSVWRPKIETADR